MLILAVLLQPGKTDAGALFTSNVSSSAYGPRGTATVLSKTTIVAATVFMLSALMLSMPGLTGDTSVLSTNPEAPATAPANTSTNANVDTNAATNAANSAVTVPPITDLSNIAPVNTSNTGATNTNTASNTAKTNTSKANTTKANANK